MGMLIFYGSQSYLKQEEKFMIIVAALYKFVSVLEPQAMCTRLKNLCKEQNIFGTLLVAHEGINGTVAGSRSGIDRLKALLEDEGFIDMEYKESMAPSNPFCRMKVKLKKEIVTLGCPEAKPSEIVGTYVSPKQWNELLNDPEVVLIDVRNDYEVELGTFKNALNPKTTSFREFPEYVNTKLDPLKHKKVAMACTGGIRCEKASSYMKKMGFADVYHLKGGILQYLQDVEPAQSLWEGECFVFDNRVTVDHDLKVGSYDLCHGCRFPISAEDKASPHFVKGVTCPRCVNNRSEAQKASAQARQKQIDLAKAQGRQHIGPSSKNEQRAKY